MPSIELSLALGLGPQTPTVSGRGDAVGFAGLLDDQARPQPRGRLGVGRALADQLQAEGAAQGQDPTVTPLVLPGLLVPPPVLTDADVKDGGPRILPADPDGGAMTKTAGPQILPGAPDGATTTKSDGAQVLPSVADGSGAGKTPAPLVLPGDLDVTVKAERPLVLPGDTPDLNSSLLGLLTARSGQARADGAAETIRRLVSQAPQVSAPAEGEDPLAAEPAMPSLSTTAAGSAPSGTRPVQARTDSGAASGASARVDTPVARTASEAVDASQAGLETPTDDGIEVVPLAAREPVASQPARPDAAAVQRQSFDAITQVAAQIIRRLEGRSTRFEMELHPASMGRVDVRLDIDAEGRVAARLAFDNPAAAADLRGRADELRRNLEEAGFQLADDALDFADREGRRRGDASDRDPFERSTREADVVDAEAQPVLRSLNRLSLDVRI